MVLSFAFLTGSAVAAGSGGLRLCFAGPAEIVEALKGTQAGKALVEAVIGRDLEAVTDESLGVFGFRLTGSGSVRVGDGLEIREKQLERLRGWLEAHRSAVSNPEGVLRRFAEVEVAGLVAELEKSGYPGFSVTREKFLGPEVPSEPHPLDSELAAVTEAQRFELLSGTITDTARARTLNTVLETPSGATRLGDLLPAPLASSEGWVSRFTGWRVGTKSGSPLMAEADLKSRGALEIEIYPSGEIRATVSHLTMPAKNDFVFTLSFAVAETRRLTGSSFRPRANSFGANAVGGGETEIRGLSADDGGSSAAFLAILTTIAR